MLLCYFRLESLATSSEARLIDEETSSSSSQKTRNQNTSISSLSFSQETEPEEEKFILTLYGKGIQGIIPGRILFRIEEDLKEKYGQIIRLSSVFDIISGCSTGGIIALCMTAPVKIKKEEDLVKEYNLEGMFDGSASGYPPDMWTRVYKKHASKIAPRYEKWWHYPWYLFSSTYNMQELERYLSNSFKTHSLKEATTRVIIPVKNLKTAQPYTFDSTDINADTSMKDIARATLSLTLPKYFPPINITISEIEMELNGDLSFDNLTRIVSNTVGDGVIRKAFVASLRVVSELTSSSPQAEVNLNNNIEFERKNNVQIQTILTDDQKAMDKITIENISQLEAIADAIFEGKKEDEATQNCILLRNKIEERILLRNMLPDEMLQICSLERSIYLKCLQLMTSKELHLEGEKVDTDTLSNIRSLISKRYGNNFKFLCLNLSNTFIDDDSIHLIVKRIVYPSSVEKLILDGNTHITEIGLRQLCTLLYESPVVLTNLSLQNLGMTEEIARSFVELSKGKPHIKEIRLGGNKISEEITNYLRSDKISFEFKTW